VDFNGFEAALRLHKNITNNREGEREMSKGIRLGGFWPKQAQDGTWYLEGPFGNTTVRVYENSYKKTDKDPSHVMYLSEKPKAQGAPRPPQAPQGGFSPRNHAPQSPHGLTPRGPAVAQSQPPFKDHTQGAGSAPPGQWDPADDGSDLPF
jgi:hypothetical protein